MPTKDKKRGTWTAVIQRRDLPFKKRRGFKTKSQAAQWERNELERLLNPQPIPITFIEAVDKYLEWASKRREKNTYRQKLFIVKEFLKSLGYNPPLDQVNNNLIESYLDKCFEANNGKTANRHLREIKTAFNWFVSRGLIDKNPCNSIEKYKEDVYKKYVPPAKDINDVMLKTEKGWEQDFLQCIFHTAARRVEILRLTWDDINFQTSTIKLWTKKRKDGSLESDELHMNATLKNTLQNRFRKRDQNSNYVFPGNAEGMISKYTVDKLMPRLCERAGVKKFGLHAIRHYTASVMADSKKLSLIDIQKMLRHKRATTTDIYLDQLAESKTTAAEILEESFGKIQSIQPTEQSKASSVENMPDQKDYENSRKA